MSSTVPRGPPRDVDARTHGRIARTFYVYRMVRSSVTALVALLGVPVTIAAGAPWFVPVLFAVAVVAMGLRIWQTRQRWRAAQASFEA